MMISAEDAGNSTAACKEFMDANIKRGHGKHDFKAETSPDMNLDAD